MSETLPVTVVTGFLGAGKTTLVNQWLSLAGDGDIAVIVNEHGVIGIDGELLAARARVLMEISGGCVCCTTQADLVRALQTFANSPIQPRRVLVETSGAASPAGVVRAIHTSAQRTPVVLDGIVTVLDAVRAQSSLQQGVALEQLGYADVVVLTRADVCAQEQLLEARELCAAQNEAAVIVEAARGSLTRPACATLEQLLALRDAELPVQRAFRIPATTHVYESLCFEHEGDLDGERFADFVEAEVAKFAGRIFRIKGILAVRGLEVRLIVQGVADAVELTFGNAWADAPRRSRLVVVGFGLDRAALEEGFRACT